MAAGAPPVVSADFDDLGNIVFTKKADASLLLTFTDSLIESKVPIAPAPVVALQVLPGTSVVQMIPVADAVTGNVDVVLTYKTRITDVKVVKTAGAGAAGNTIQVKNGTNAITDAIDTNVADQAIAKAGSINDLYHEIAAGGTLRVASTKAGGNAACIVYVHGILVP